MTLPDMQGHITVSYFNRNMQVKIPWRVKAQSNAECVSECDQILTAAW